VLFWGTAYTGVRIALDDFGPGELAFGRFAVAAIVLVLLSILRSAAGNPAAALGPAPDRRDLPPLVALGLVGITAYHLLLNFGQQRVSPGVTSLILQTAPVFTTILVSVLGIERAPWRVWLGIAIASAGTSLLILGQGRDLTLRLSALLIVGCALTTSIYFVFQRRLAARYGTWKFTVWTILVAAVSLGVYAPSFAGQAPHAHWQGWAALAYLGAFPGAAGYALWSFAISELGAATCASLLYFAPIVAFAFAWLLLGQPPTASALAGGALTLAGVVLVNRARAHAAALARAAEAP
jgi:drug/metabolite transporter (DMT)-like permease